MKYSVDKIENDIVVLENIENNDIINVNISLLPNGIKEKDIVFYNGENYVLDNLEKEDRLKRIMEKMNRLRSE